MIGEGVSPLTIDSPETECPAISFACSWCPFRDYCERRLKQHKAAMENMM